MSEEELKIYPHEEPQAPAPGQVFPALPRPRPKADADGAAIAALICAFLIPVLGIVFGHVARGQAKRAGLEPSGVATAGCVLGYLFTALGVIIVITVLVAAAKAGNSVPCDPSNPTWPYC